MIRVLVVDDSPATRELLIYILESDPQIKVVGTAGDGNEAIEAVAKIQPDVITMDILMPGMDGVNAVRKIMETNPIPTVIISASMNPGESGSAFSAMEAGAIAVCEKPKGLKHADFKSQSKKIIQTVKLVSQVKVVLRRRYAKTGVALRAVEARIGLVAIGVSTGGPMVLCSLLSGLKKNFPCPILIVQHIAPGFLPGLVNWLSNSSGIRVEVARDGQAAEAGRAYIAPDGHHMEISRKCVIRLTECAPVNGMRPSITVLFDAVAEVFGESAAGILLTGMGKDGAEALLRMKRRGCLTIAQDKESSVVYGMPGEAIKIGAARYVLPPELIADVLNKRAGTKE